jgi:endo-alpha-1,4-polygalactosaminidase (GH114 family)
VFVLLAACSGDDGEAGAEAEDGAQHTHTTGTPGDDGITSTGDHGTAATGSDASDATAAAETTGASDDTGPGSTACADPGVWCPAPGTTWHWQLTGALDDSIDAQMYDIDLFDPSAATIAGLHDDGRVVVCYLSAGSHEDWRPDADVFDPASIGDPLDDWPGEHWVDIRHPSVRDALAGRLDLAVDKGCDGVEPDNVDGYQNQTGFDLTADDQLEFNGWLAAQAHARGLSVGLKNDLDQVAALEPQFDWALDEECFAYDECDLLAPFIDAGKAVFHVEYVDAVADGPALHAEVCPQALARMFSSLIKRWDLDAWSMPCG